MFENLFFLLLGLFGSVLVVVLFFLEVWVKWLWCLCVGLLFLM